MEYRHSWPLLRQRSRPSKRDRIIAANCPVVHWVSSSWQVAQISESQIEQIAELCGRAGEFVSRRQLSDYWLYVRLFGETCLCVEDEGRLLGVLLAFQDQTPGSAEIYVQDLAVEEDSRRRGVAEALMREIQIRAAN